MQTEEKTTPLEVEAAQPANLPAQRQQHQVAQAQQTTPMDLLRIVTERGASPEQIAQYMDLMDRQEAKMARQAYVRAMAEFKKNPPDIYKDKDVAFNGTAYSHATLGNICEKIIGALAGHGISHDWRIDQPGSGMIRVTCTLTHDMGHSESTSMEAPADNSGKKNPIQSIASSVTYLQRYTLLSACGIAVKEQGDDDGRGEAPAPEPIYSRNWIEAAGAAKTEDELGSTWKSGLAEIEAAKDRTMYDQFKQAVNARKTILTRGDSNAA